MPDLFPRQPSQHEATLAFALVSNRKSQHPVIVHLLQPSHSPVPFTHPYLFRVTRCEKRASGRPLLPLAKQHPIRSVRQLFVNKVTVTPALNHLVHDFTKIASICLYYFPTSSSDGAVDLLILLNKMYSVMAVCRQKKCCTVRTHNSVLVSSSMDT